MTKYDFLYENLRRAANRSNPQEIAVSVSDLLAIGHTQNWKCALTGWDLEFERGGTYWGGKWCNPMSCTIDRIDNSKGYVPGNVQLVTWYVNKTKGHLDNGEFINMCKDIANHA